MTEWDTTQENVWYAYGTLLGEADADVKSTRKTHSLRLSRNTNR